MLVQWKKILQLPTTGVVAERSRESLPEPPNGTEWHQDPVTKQWSLQKVSEKKKEEPELVTEPKKEEERPFPRLVDQLPPRRPSAAGGGHSASERGGEEDWEFLSDKQSVSSHQSSSVGAIFVPRAGSVRSITSMEHVSQSSHTTPLSVPFKIQRTASSSTIDSQEAALGPSGKGVLGVDYVEHVILPTDTLQGICLSYRISVTKLRQANHFSGNSLLLAPKKLVIPISKKALRQGFIRVQDTDAKEYKLHAFLAEFPDFGLTEAKAYVR
jgi:LysM repeat protein